MRPIVARDLMTPDVLQVDEELALPELAAYLTENEITGAVVANEEGELVGVVSVTDIAASASPTAAADDGDWRERRLDFYAHGWEEDFDLDDLREVDFEDPEVTAGDIMTPDLYSVDVDASVSQVATLMLDSQIHRVFVVENHELVGVISTSDMLGLLIEES